MRNNWQQKLNLAMAFFFFFFLVFDKKKCGNLYKMLLLFGIELRAWYDMQASMWQITEAERNYSISSQCYCKVTIIQQATLIG